MNHRGPDKILRQILNYEAATFILLTAVVWLNEYVHFPSKILGAEPENFKWQEALFETVIIGAAGLFIISATRRVMRRLNQLEGILPICASCKSIQDDQGNWQRVEQYVHDHSNADFSHGLCPDCAREYKQNLQPAP